MHRVDPPVAPRTIAAAAPQAPYTSACAGSSDVAGTGILAQEAIPAVVVRSIGRIPYRECLDAMRTFTATRAPLTPDELWLVEHDPVYTVGVAGRSEHFPRGTAVPVEHVDRGGQITFHGPGQAIVYCLIDLRRRGLTVRAMVCAMEQAVIDALADCGIAAARRSGAPGVYVEGAKIAALGLRVRNGACYHGLALNVSVDLAPFTAIDPCGYPGMPVTRTADLGVALNTSVLGARVGDHLIAVLDANCLRRGQQV